MQLPVELFKSTNCCKSPQKDSASATLNYFEEWKGTLICSPALIFFPLVNKMVQTINFIYWTLH